MAGDKVSDALWQGSDAGISDSSRIFVWRKFVKKFQNAV
jgi:hypothetical protein